VQRIILKRLVTVAAMVLAMVLAIAVPTLAQTLPQGESRVTDPVSDGGSVPEDVDTIPIKLSSELCADLTNPLVSGTFSLVVPDLVTGCLNRASEPTDPADTAPVQTVSDTSLTPSVNQAPVEEPGSVEPASGHLAELTDKTAPADTAAPADTTTVPSV
jgi:septal ring-binding cell division protein DamX